MTTYKGVGNFDKYFSPNLNITHQRPIRNPMKYRHLFPKLGSSVKLPFDFLVVHYGLLNMVTFTSSTVV